MNVNRRLPKRTLTLTGLLALAITALTGPTAAAGTELDTAQAQITIGADGTSTVQINYHINGAQEGEPSDTIGFSALPFQGAAIEDLQVTTGDGAALDHRTDSANGKTAIEVVLPEPLPAGQQTDLTITYTVPNAGALDGDQLTTNVPIVAPNDPAPDADPDNFTATVQLPDGHTHIEGFPATADEATDSGGVTTLHYSLPAVPALVRAVTTTGETSWLSTTESQMELILLLAIIAGLIAIYFSFIRPMRQGRGPTDPSSQSASAQTTELQPTHDQS